MLDKFGQFIDGKWQKSSSGETYDVINPATEEVVGKASKANSEDIQKALKSAEKGLKIWKNTAPWERAKIIRKNPKGNLINFIIILNVVSIILKMFFIIYFIQI